MQLNAYWNMEFQNPRVARNGRGTRPSVFPSGGVQLKRISREKVPKMYISTSQYLNIIFTGLHIFSWQSFVFCTELYLTKCQLPPAAWKYSFQFTSTCKNLGDFCIFGENSGVSFHHFATAQLRVRWDYKPGFQFQFIWRFVKEYCQACGICEVGWSRL